jgi:hypothetical protein
VIACHEPAGGSSEPSRALAAPQREVAGRVGKGQLLAGNKLGRGPVPAGTGDRSKRQLVGTRLRQRGLTDGENKGPDSNRD